MARALWNDEILAESEDTVEIEGSCYFPPDSIRWEYFEKSETRTTCRWKGEASYYSIRVNGKVNIDGAWYYPQPSEAAQALGIKDRLAFWKGVRIER